MEGAEASLLFCICGPRLTNIQQRADDAGVVQMSSLQASA